MKKKFIFENKNFKIRETLESDIKIWYKWFNDPEITKFLIHGAYPNTLENQKKFRLKYIGEKERLIFSVLDKKGKKLIGTCSINLFQPLTSRRCAISLVVGDKNYHKGNLYLLINMWLINHAFKELGMNSIVTGFFADNHVVKRTVEILGFKKIGLERERYFKGGKFHNVWMYDLLKKNWKNL